MNRITKRQLREALKATSEGELASFFGISPSAVSQWEEDAPIPKLRWLEAVHKRPDLFSAASRMSDEDNDPHRRPAAEAGGAAEAAPATTPLSEAA